MIVIGIQEARLYDVAVALEPAPGEGAASAVTIPMSMVGTAPDFPTYDTLCEANFTVTDSASS